MRNNRVHAIAPMIKIKKNGVECLEFAGVSQLYEPGGFLYRDQESLQELIAHLMRFKIPVLLQRFHRDEAISGMFKKLVRLPTLYFERTVSGSPWLPTDRNWESYFNSISPKRRYDLRRAFRRAENAGGHEIKILNPDKNEVRKLLELAFLVESSGWKTRAGSSILSNKKLYHFFSAYLMNICENQNLRLGLLYINNEPAAMLIGLQYAGRFWVLKIGYDESFARCSPGIILVHATIKYAFDNNLTSYEFLGTEESWIRVWSRHIRTQDMVVIYPFSPEGIRGIITDGIRYLYKRVEKQNTTSSDARPNLN